MTSRSEQLFEEAKLLMPGGVNSPVRAFSRVGGHPVFFERGSGSHLIDVDGQTFIDYVGSFGPAVVGHAHPYVVEKVQEAASKGFGFGAPTENENRLAELICGLMPSIEMIRMVNSGTEATMSAIRIARGFTGRDKIVKFEGCYHGHSDSLLVKAGSGALTLGEPDSLGVPKSFAEHTITLDYNNQSSAERLFAQMGDKIAAVIVEPVAGNMSCVPPAPGFLKCLRQLCDQHQSVLIFDEVMTGFRVALGGAQDIYNITPDMTALGKVIGGGLPVGAFGGKAEIMNQVAPLGGVYQAGTLSGNPIAMAAGLATLELVQAPDFFENLTRKTSDLTHSLQTAADEAGVGFTTNQVGGMFGLFFSDTPVTRFSEVMDTDTAKFNNFFNSMLSRHINLAPSPFEAGFVSSAHSDEDIGITITSASESFKALR